MIYSHSRLNTFQNCKQAFKFRYIDNIKTDKEGIEAFMGKRVHEALEYLYEKVKFGVVPELGSILGKYVENWDKEFHEKINVVKKEYSIQDYQKLGEKCIINYYNDHYPFNQNVLENEKLITVEIDGIKLRGFIDRVDHDGDTIEIIDYKTGMSLPSQAKIDKDRQLALYQLGLQEIFPEVKNYKLKWHYLAFGKILESQRSEEDLEYLKQDIKKIVQEIEQENDYLPKPSRLCDWCEYKSICPAFNHERVNSEQKKSNAELVSEYVALKSEAGTIKQKLIDLRDQIIQVADETGIQIFQDDSYQVKLTEFSRLALPKEAELQDELLAAVKAAGILEKVSKLSLAELQTLMEELPPETQKTIRPFLNEEVSKKLTISRL